MAGELQSILFDKEIYTPKYITKWLKAHNLRLDKPLHETDNYYRVRIRNPENYESFRTKKITPYLYFVIGLN